MTSTVATRPPAPPLPTQQFDVPSSIQSQLRTQAAAGRADTLTWLQSHPTGTVAEFGSFLGERIGVPPTGGFARADGEWVRRAEASRTPELAPVAEWHDKHGVHDLWKVGTSGAVDAAEGAELLQRTKELVSTIVIPLKEQHNRPRPFASNIGVSQSAGISRVGTASFPSGHSAHSYAASDILGHLEPARAEGLSDLADQVAYSRVYAGVHFPSDIVAGAYIGSAAATFARARPDVDIPPRPNPL